jgi:aryl-alcohol dehydrogenase-like predicted oxidoreductase
MMSYGSPNWRNWVLPENLARPLVKHAAKLGINFFDTADLYSQGVSEEVTGRLLKEIFQSRDEYVLATKVCLPMGELPNQKGLSRKHILGGIEASLQRLGTDYIDLYQIHRWDPETPIEETMQTLDDIVRAGKVRYIGASSMWAWQFSKLQYTADLHGWTRFISMQNHYNLLSREDEREMIPFCLDQGIGLIPWSPLARGLLARKPGTVQLTKRAQSDVVVPKLYNAERDSTVLENLEKVCKSLEISLAQGAIAWLLNKPGVTSPIIGATKKEQLDELVEATDIELNSPQMEILDSGYQPQLPPELIMKQ